MKRYFILKWFGRISISLGWLGAALFLLSLLGFFEPKDRIRFYEKMQEEKGITQINETARNLLRDFGFPEEQIQMIRAFEIKGLSYSTMNRTLAGVVVAVADEDHKRTIGDIADIRAWAYISTRVYDWISFILLVSSLTIGHLIDYFKKDGGTK
jgi:hypothetical protein